MCCDVFCCAMLCVEKWWYCRWLWWLLARPPGSPISHGASQLTTLIGTTAAACVNIGNIASRALPARPGQSALWSSLELEAATLLFVFITKLRVKMRACVNMRYCRYCRVITASSILLNTQEPGHCRIWNFYLFGQYSILHIPQYVKNQCIISFDRCYTVKAVPLCWSWVLVGVGGVPVRSAPVAS